MIKNWFTVNEVANVLDIYEVSAKELLDDIIPFEPDEIAQLASYKNISIEKLLEERV